MVSAERTTQGLQILLLLLILGIPAAWAQGSATTSGTIVGTPDGEAASAAAPVRNGESCAADEPATGTPENQGCVPPSESSTRSHLINRNKRNKTISSGAKAQFLADLSVGAEAPTPATLIYEIASRGQTPQTGVPDGSSSGQSNSGGQSNFSPSPRSKNQNVYGAWRKMAEREESSEPDWLSPLATTSGRIKDELRYDIWRQTTPAGARISTFGGGKGLEFIAAPRVQLLLGIPSYLEHSAAIPPDGFGDLPLMLKLRMASSNVAEGNYLVTFLLSATAPTGPRPNGSGAAVLTPTLALGKGWGSFDVQTTLGGNLPAGDTRRLGKQVLWNTTFQYRARWKLWPELEVNSTFFEQGPSSGQTQSFLTPGLGFGRVRLFRHVRFSTAGGLQIAVTRFHTYNHRWMLSVRFPF